MRWLDATTVLLDPNAEVAADYACCADAAPPPPCFSLARPYGAAAQTHDDAAASDGEGAEARESEAAGESADVRKRRRKRRRRESDDAAALRAQRGNEAERRHTEALPLLENALSFYAAHLAAVAPLTARSHPKAGPAPCGGDSPEEEPLTSAARLAALVAAAEEGMPLQLELCTANADGADAWRSAPLTGRVHANAGDGCGRAALGELRFALPPRCRFALGSAARLHSVAGQLRGGGGGFRLIVIDPPWECASVARSCAYATLSCGQIQALPVRELCHVGGALVALWVTNRERIRRHVETAMLPAWGLELVAEWHWLKVAADGAPALPLRGSGPGCRRPYEPLLLARTAAVGNAAGPAIPRRAVLLAPPGAHSRKPRLLRLLRPLAPCSDALAHEPPRPSGLEACELFARELCADATSWGNEPLRFQAVATAND